MTYFIAALIAFVVLLVPVVYFFIERKYKLMVVAMIVNLFITSGLLYISIQYLKI
jgi:hypothetical protein